jgi:methylmalonyl-CoA mutase N-terminal domain/subunit
VEAKERIIIGVNAFTADADVVPPTLYIDESAGTRQVARLDAVRGRRDAPAVERALARVRDDASGTANLMESLVAAVRAEATLGEMCGALRDVWGEYEETPSV